MFKKLQIQMTLFGACITSLILVSFSVFCFHLIRDNLKSTSYQSFLSEMNTDILHLQEQESLSLRWIGQLQENSNLLFFLYDNQNPLYVQNYISRSQDEESAASIQDELPEEVMDYAANQYALDIRLSVKGQLTEHVEFSFQSKAGEQFYASVGRIPKENGQFGFVILYPLAAQQEKSAQILLMVCILDVISIGLLFLFFWYFTAKMIRPLKEAQEKQTLFIASASHELRAPLAVWMSGLEVLSKTDDREERQHFTHLLVDEGVRMKHLVDELLMLARSDSRKLQLNRQRCQPDSLLLDVYEKSEPVAAKKSIHLSIELPEELMEDAFLDMQRMTQALEILISNALSYTPAQGQVRLSLYQERQRLCFMVSDTGCGIPDREKTKIFERFYRCDQSRTDKEHFGLGLCIAKEIVEAHGGEILVTDAPGGGSCFRIWLPIKGTF